LVVDFINERDGIHFSGASLIDALFEKDGVFLRGADRIGGDDSRFEACDDGHDTFQVMVMKR
jgi:hypothetical protein